MTRRRRRQRYPVLRRCSISISSWSAYFHAQAARLPCPGGEVTKRGLSRREGALTAAALQGPMDAGQAATSAAGGANARFRPEADIVAATQARTSFASGERKFHRTLLT